MNQYDLDIQKALRELDEEFPGLQELDSPIKIRWSSQFCKETCEQTKRILSFLQPLSF
jgi:hypothetical protein